MIRLAVDAANLVQDRRGMGRVVRPILQAAMRDPSIAVTFLASENAARVLKNDFGEDAVVCAPRCARTRGQYDVVWLPFNGMRFRCAAPVLVTIYDVFAFTEPARGFVARRREQAPIRRAAQRATRILTISRWSAEQIATVLHIDAQRIVVVPPAPDPFFFPATGDALPPELDGKRFALFVAGPETRKNADMLIEACTKALAPPHETLAIVGNLSPNSERRLLHMGTPFVRVRADDALLRTLYRGATVVAVPSLGEGFGLVAAEAMACAAPVIAANASALPQTTGDAALLIDPHDVQAWATAIRRLFDRADERAELSARAATRYAFSDRRAPITSTLALLRRLADTSD